MPKAVQFSILILAVIAGAYFFHQHHNNSNSVEITASEKSLAEKNAGGSPDSTQPPPASEADAPLIENQDEGQEQVVELTEANFESEIDKCFTVQTCELSENAWRLYQEFKKNKSAKVVTQLISFLKTKLRDPELKDVYSEDVKKMIDDFYPPGERDFQDAEYYSDIGESQKSLDLFLDLQQRAASDPTLKTAPNASIGNVLYDLNRLDDALIYYQMALNDVETGKQGTKSEERSQFLQTRINEIKEKLGTQETDDSAD